MAYWSGKKIETPDFSHSLESLLLTKTLLAPFTAHIVCEFSIAKLLPSLGIERRFSNLGKTPLVFQQLLKNL
jgi:hypothetical protein